MQDARNWSGTEHLPVHHPRVLTLDLCHPLPLPFCVSLWIILDPLFGYLLHALHFRIEELISRDMGLASLPQLQDAELLRRLP